MQESVSSVPGKGRHIKQKYQQKPLQARGKREEYHMPK